VRRLLIVPGEGVSVRHKSQQPGPDTRL
jgi:hypothetical protein